ncbi:hypothetical protein JNM05_05435 [bacterium]|nr:hypothetical protein [bacterium]
MRNFLKIGSACFIIGLIACSLISCDKNSSSLFESGTYSYYGYDLDGQKVTEGWITVTVEDSLIEGTKNIVEMIIGGSYLMEVGVGLISGRISEDGTIEIYLLEAHGPYMLIRGHYYDDVLKGNRYWGVSGGAPETVIGTFEAPRNK